MAGQSSSRAPRETRGWSADFFERLIDVGFVVAASDYRFSDEAPFPAQLDDVLEALRWLGEHTGDLGVDAPAGAVGRIRRWPPRRPRRPGAGGAPVNGVVAWYPITDLLALDQEATDTFEAHLLGGPIGERTELARRASPVTYVRADAPPFLLQHGEADTWVPFDQSLRLADALRAPGGSVKLEVVPGADHFFEGADPEPISARPRLPATRQTPSSHDLEARDGRAAAAHRAGPRDGWRRQGRSPARVRQAHHPRARRPGGRPRLVRRDRHHRRRRNYDETGS